MILKERLVDARTEKDKIDPLIQLSTYYQQIGRLPQALEYSQKVIKIAQAENDPELLGDGFVNMGISFFLMGEYEKALECYLKGYQNYDKIFEKDGVAYVSYNLADIYTKMRNYPLSLKYSDIALQHYIQSKRGKKMAECHVQQGVIYYHMDVPKKSLDNFEKALIYYKSVGDKKNCAAMDNNIGSLFNEMKQYDRAIQNYKYALSIYTELNDTLGIAMTMANIGNIYNEAGKMEEALPYIQKGFEIAEDKRDNNILVPTYIYMIESYEKLGNYPKAFEFQSRLLKLKDTIYDLQVNMNIAEMQTRFDTEKKEKENEILRQQNELKDLNLDNQKIISYSVSGGLLLMLVLAFYIYHGFRQKQKANNLLEKKQVEIVSKNMALEVANTIIHEKNKDITDSIRYAKRLQTAILKPEDTLSDYFSDGFIFFKPKDIVSGDFYWFEKFGSRSFFAAADCTGHGVPGAFMSIIGCNLLSQAVNENNITNPDAILNSVNKGLSKVLQQRIKEMSVKDGMDIALCVFNADTMMLEYSGAYNPIWHVRDGKLAEYKADKFPVGAFVDDEIRFFKKHEIRVEKGDLIYLFSDGYADQFGGMGGKKFKYKTLQKLILENYSKPASVQKAVFENTFENWMGNLEQVDDVLLMCVQI